MNEIGVILIAGCAAAMSAYLMIVRLGLRRMLKYEVALDLMFDVVIPYLFSGSFTGMAAAAIAGIVLTIMLVISRLIIGEDHDNSYEEEESYDL